MPFKFFTPKSKLFRPKSAPVRQDGKATRIHVVSGLLVALMMWVAVMFLLHGGSVRRYSNLALEQKAPATVVAVVDFTCEDTARTELNRRQAVDQILPVFTINQGLYGSATRKLDKLFDRIIQHRLAALQNPVVGDIQIEVSDVLDLLDLPLKPEEALAMAPEGQEETVLNVIKEALKEIWNEGIASLSEKETLFQGVAAGGRLAIVKPDEKNDVSVLVEDLSTPDQGVKSAIALIRSKVKKDGVTEQNLTQLLSPLVRPNLVFDARSTNERKEQAVRKIERASMKVRAGTMLMENRERITPQILEMLQAHERRLLETESTQDRLLKWAGDGGLVVAFLLISLGILHFSNTDLLKRHAAIILFVLLTLLSLLLTKGMIFMSQHARLISPWLVEYAIPLALPSLLAGILLGPAAAIALGIWISLLTALMFDYSFSVFVIGVIATVAAALTTRNIRRRVHVLRAGLLIGLAEVLLAFSFAALDRQALPVMFYQALAGLLSGVISALIVTIMLPFFEWLFQITTPISLLELSDMSHPLLQRLAMEAPGTYHHSLMVASLGQTAAMTIGVNELLVRVCGYYHDVRKLTKPEFFSENTHLRENPHDDLAPSMSALVILSHIKDGISLAQRFKLPRAVIDGIQQHHGTSMVSYFYHLARQRQEAEAGGNARGGRPVNEEDFRYEGPKPSSPELAILSIADAVEAASRSLEKPTPIRIENMVNDIISAKLSDGQLDQCRLTFAQLSQIKKSLIFSLANMLHGRIAYQQDEIKPGQSTIKTEDPQAGSSAPRPMAPGQD
ncbi:MAG: HDIG domain-containing metalloprotein [Lentisphaerota bacterium]